MKLFHSTHFKPQEHNDDRRIVTHLGSLETAFESLSGSRLPVMTLNSRCFRHDHRRATVYQWSSPECLIEELQLDFEPKHPTCLGLIGSAVVIRLQCLAELFGIAVIIRWLPGHHWADGYPESGEGLEARTWTDGKSAVTIGTEDVDFLCARASKGKWISSRLTSIIANSTEMVDVRKDGLSIAIPRLKTSECFQLQFVVCSGPRNDESSTWFAVDQNPSLLLSEADCA